MSNPTSNFGWQMPTPVDLVTDLPADFEVFGQAVDSSMADLKGGTTGQILSKATNTDMDFVWITNDQGDITGITATSPLTGGGTSGAVTVGIQSATTSQSGAVQLSDSTSTTSSVLAATPTAVKASYDLAAAAIPKSTVTAKGSIVAASASSTPAQLAVGNNGETIVADGSTTTGLRYTAGNPIPNPVINSAAQIWQRGTSIALAASSGQSYTADRWVTYTSANQACTISRQATNDTTNLPNIQYGLRYQRNSGQTGTSALVLVNMFESINSVPFAGKTVTFSFYAKAGANFSPTSTILQSYLVSGTGTDQNYFVGFTNNSVVANTNPSLTTTWQRYTVTGTVASNVSQLAIVFITSPTGTAGAADFFEITGVQVDIGSVALPFRTNGATIQGETSACQRYYYRITPTQVGSQLGYGMAFSSTGALIGFAYPETMRVRPTALEQSGTAANYGTVRANTAVDNLTSVPTFYSGTDTTQGVIQTASANLVSGNATSLFANSTSAYLGWSAEL